MLFPRSGGTDREPQNLRLEAAPGGGRGARLEVRNAVALIVHQGTWLTEDNLRAPWDLGPIGQAPRIGHGSISESVYTTLASMIMVLRSGAATASDRR